jgi:hypothetical protein
MPCGASSTYGAIATTPAAIVADARSSNKSWRAKPRGPQTARPPGSQNNCQDFSWIFRHPKEFDRKFQVEIFKISLLNLQDLSPKFAVKFQPILKPLIISALQNRPKISDFVKIFHNFYAPPYPPISPPPAGFSTPQKGIRFTRKPLRKKAGKEKKQEKFGGSTFLSYLRNRLTKMVR